MNKFSNMQKHLPILLLGICCFLFYPKHSQSQKIHQNKTAKKSAKKARALYGTASYYAKKFAGRRMTNGEIYRPEKYTAACNVLPLNTWIKVTNLKNNRSVIVKIKDRMNRKNTRLVDLSYSAAKKLGYLSRGLTKVKVEVLKNYKPHKK